MPTSAGGLSPRKSPIPDRYSDGSLFETTEDGWPLCPEGYTDTDETTGTRVFRGPEVGSGAFAKVMQTSCVGKGGEVVQVAVKVMKLENITTSMEEIQMEVRAMKMNRHPNVLDLYCCFVVESELWMVMPLMSKGSCYYAMKKLSSHGAPTGFGEDIVACILFDLLMGLRYVHENHQIHRDIKAGNLLLSEDGCIKIADFGVAGWFHKEDGLSRTRKRSGSSGEEGGGGVGGGGGGGGGGRGGGGGGGGGEEERRTTFVGTPCWMAPEVMESHKSNRSYNEKVDVWSMGITALELAKGYAPYSKLSPMTVILKTLQEAPPSLRSYEGPLLPFSDAFHAFVARCLIKNPKDRPATMDLLADPFFKRLESDAPRESLLALLKRIPDVFSMGSRKSEATPSEPTITHAPGTTWNFLEEDLKVLSAINPNVNVPSTLAEGEDEEEEKEEEDVTIEDLAELLQGFGGDGEGNEDGQ